ASLADHFDVVGDDVGRIAGGMPRLAAEDADVAGAVAIRLGNLPEPASAFDFRERDRSHERGGDSFFRRDASVGVTIRLPVSVASGMRLWVMSKRIVDSGTPIDLRSSIIAAAIAASWPVTPSTAR